MGTTASTGKTTLGTTTASTITGGSTTEVIPPWVYTVKVPPEFAADKIGACSDGMSLLGTSMITRFRPGQFDTDGARWERGFTSGKHTFEITFPMDHRGTHAGVGVGTAEAALHMKGKVNLVGLNTHSWGICLRSRRSYHKGAIVKKFPTSQAYLPNKFFMYFDADAGTLQFGSDVDYYGGAINGIPRQEPLYPMVSCTSPGATITMVYRGRGSTENVIPVQGQVVAVAVVHQQQYQGQPQYPQQPQQYPPQHQQYPPQHQQYPPQHQQYPPQHQQYPPQHQQYPPQHQQYPPPQEPQHPPPYSQKHQEALGGGPAAEGGAAPSSSAAAAEAAPAPAPAAAPAPAPAPAAEAAPAPAPAPATADGEGKGGEETGPVPPPST